MAKKRGLAANRGLDALLGSIKKEKAITASALQADSLVDGQTDSSIQTQTPATKSALERKSPVAKSQGQKVQTDEEMCLVQIDVHQLQSGKYQPRRDMSEQALAELAASIKQHGVMQPIVIRPLLANEDKVSETVTHEIIAGERRWRAAKMAGETKIPAIERVLSDELAIALALIENIQREDLSVIEQAAALQRFNTEFGMSHAMIAEVVGKARTTVSNLLRLNQLHDSVKNYLAESQLDMGHARALLSLSAEQQPIIAKKIIDGQMTVREAEKLVKSILHPQTDDKRPVPQDEHEVTKLTQRLSETLGATVKVKQKKNGKGSVEIFFHSEEEFAELLKQLQS